MAFIGNRGQMPQKGTLAYFEKQSAGARSALFGVLLFTVINIVLVLLGKSDTMFLFSSELPWELAIITQMIYEETGVFSIVFAGIAVVYMLALLLCAIFWKKGIAAGIVASVLYFVDCAYVAFNCVDADSEYISAILPVAIFHVLVMVYLIVGVVNESKARKLRKAAEAAAAGPEM